MPFEILQITEATLTTFTGRTETHGKSKVPAISFRLRFSGPNTLLDLLSPDVRKTLYMAEPGQEDLPGVEATTPLLRCKNIKTWSPENAYEGWTVTIDRSGNEQDDIELGGSKIDAFTVDLHDDPGMVDIECRVGTHHLTPDEAGYLWSKQQQKVFVMLAAPLTPSTNPEAGERDPNQLTLDGSTGGEIGEPSEARLAAEAAFIQRITDCPSCGPSEFDREEGTATCLGCGWTTRVHFHPGSEGMDPNEMRAFPDAVDGEDDEQDAGEHVADDVDQHGAGNSAKTPAQIRAAKAAATRRANAAAS